MISYNLCMSKITDVTDTAIWVAAYRAEENERKDALFRDPFARLLIGEHGQALARRTQGSRYTAWSVIIRTCIIDQFIHELLQNEKIDTVLNLGAGLDTRPYRLSLPPDLRWIEVDFEKVIAHKNETLANERPVCRLERVALDLSQAEKRQQFFEEISVSSQKVLVMTEGVVPYLSNEEAAQLADDLFRMKNFEYWITEYYSPEILQFLRTPKRLKQMEKAPFLFYPDDWFGFFNKHGWDQLQTKYFGIESERCGRMAPVPGWLKEDDASAKEQVKRFLGYSILRKHRE